jgi:hypothetical protein
MRAVKEFQPLDTPVEYRHYAWEAVADKLVSQGCGVMDASNSKRLWSDLRLRVAFGMPLMLSEDDIADVRAMLDARRLSQ